MQYIKIKITIKSTKPEYAKQNQVYEEYYDSIANKEEFSEEIIYFYVVDEAKNVYESSLVLFGSNGATGLIQENKTDAEIITPEIKEEPLQDTQEKKQNIFIKI